MNLVTELDKEIIESVPIKTRAEWYCLLNTWKWPEELPDPCGTSHEPNDRRSQLMRYISERVGERYISRHWNKDMNDEDFEDFWRGNYEGHAPSRERYNKRLQKWAEERAAARQTEQGAAT